MISFLVFIKSRLMLDSSGFGEVNMESRARGENKCEVDDTWLRGDSF